MIRRFHQQDVDTRLLDDARDALVDARELQTLIGSEPAEIGEVATVAQVIQDESD
jgi:hypothetical protein